MIDVESLFALKDLGGQRYLDIKSFYFPCHTRFSLQKSVVPRLWTFFAQNQGFVLILILR